MMEYDIFHTRTVADAGYKRGSRRQLRKSCLFGAGAPIESQPFAKLVACKGSAADKRVTSLHASPNTTALSGLRQDRGLQSSFPSQGQIGAGYAT